MYRKTLLPLFAAASLGLMSHPANAADVDLGNLGADDVESICDGEGGKFWTTPDGMNYGCAKKCGDSTCGVICDKEAGCLGTTPERRVTTPVDAAVVAGVLNGTIRGRDGGSDGRDGDGQWWWGLAGLLGLIGLLGLQKRDGTVRADTRRDTDTPR